MSSDRLNLPQDPGADVPRFLESKPLRSKQAAKPQKKQWIILSFLIFLLVFLMIQTLAGGKKKLQPAVNKKPVPAAAALQQAAVTPENDIFKAASLDKKERSSPFTRLPSQTGTAVAVQGPAEFVLQGILSDSGGSVYAVINEKIVKKGERMADKVVTVIQSDSVTLRSDSGEEETLRMKT